MCALYTKVGLSLCLTNFINSHGIDETAPTNLSFDHRKKYIKILVIIHFQIITTFQKSILPINRSY